MSPAFRSDIRKTSESIVDYGTGRWPAKLLLPMSAFRRLADATRSFFWADGNFATARRSLATIIAASLLLKLQHSRLSLTGVAAFGRDVYHADYQALVKFLPLEFTGEDSHKSLSMCKFHITPIHKRY